MNSDFRGQKPTDNVDLRIRMAENTEEYGKKDGSRVSPFLVAEIGDETIILGKRAAT